MSKFSKDDLWRKATEPIRKLDRRRVLGTSMAAGAAIVAASLASALTSAARRREEDM